MEIKKVKYKFFEDIQKSVDELFDEFANTTYLKKVASGSYEYEIYADYRDEISDEDALEILSSEEPMSTFQDMLFDAYLDAESYYADELLKEFSRWLSKNGYDPDMVQDFDIYEHVSFVPDYDHFLKQRFNCRITIDTGDSNADFTANPNYDTMEADENASIVWLAETQGYTREQVNDALENGSDNKFLNSIVNEAINTSSHMNQLVILCEATLQELIEAKQDKKSITVNKASCIGFFDSWNGGGSILEIEIEKPFTIPFEYIYEFVPDSKSGSYGYSVDDVYGLSGEAYRANIKIG